jgi:membrane-bound lytic murein transglycosylase F
MRPLIPIILALSLAACEPGTRPLPPVQQSRELVVITRNSPTTYYEDAQGNYAGLEYDLVSLFAKELGVNVKFIVATEFSQILPTLEKRQAHIAAAGLTVTPERQMAVRFGVPYQTVQQQVVYNSLSVKPRGLKDLLGGRIEVVGGSSYAERLQEARKLLPALSWKNVAALESEELLEHVAEGKADFTVADSHLVSMAQNYYPDLDVAFNLGSPQQLAWAFPKDGDPYIYDKAKDFFARIQQDGTLKRLLDRYYGHIERLSHADVAGFLDKVRTTLPAYRKLFQQAQEITGIDWRLLAVLGYQESHWDPTATSPTGVRGLMMLTADTADQLGVNDRLDPKENIPAGARYFLSLKDAMPDHVTEPDRTWMALAAYNSGQGHLEDARVLAQRQKLNPDAWADLKKALPLLSKAAYHTTLKHGYARGGESVIFVENIRTYYDILSKFEPPYQSPFPALASSK